jgi:phosphoglucomutase
LLDIYKEFGYYYEGLENIHLLGKTGSEKIGRIMESFRNTELSSIYNIDIMIKEDFLLSKRYHNNQVEDINLEQSDVIKYQLKDDSWFVLRPSGTEPKLKIYAGVIGDSVEDSKDKVKRLLQEVKRLVEKVE